MIFGIDEKPKDDLAIICDDGREITYGELSKRIIEIGQQFKSRCLIFCMCKNQPEALIGYLAFLDSGAVPLLLDASISTEKFDQLKEIYKPDYVWIDGELRRVVFKETESENEGVATQLNEKLALLLSTSGSTGSAKLVRLSKENIISNTEAIVEYLGITKQERALTVLPMHYTYGLSVIQTHLYAGACVLMTEKTVLEPEFWKFAKDKKATSMSGVPYTYEMLHRLKFISGGLGESVITMTQAGGHLSEMLQEEYARFADIHHKKFIVMYGQTEATARMSYLPSEDCLRKIGSIGIPIPGGKFEIEDGELVYYGPNVSLGYASSKADLSLGDERNGRLETGDLGYKDADGYYFVTGRKNRFVKIRGNRVSLDECEKLLENKYEHACDFVCTGQDDHLVIYKTSEEVFDTNLYLADALGMDYHLFEEKVIKDIPRTASGKVDYTSLLFPHPYHLAKEEKDKRLTKELVELTNYHMSACEPYQRMLKAIGYDEKKVTHYSDLPFLPAGIFKQLEMQSFGLDEPYRVATSSGTGDLVSRVLIDRDTSRAQQEALVHIGNSVLGKKRLPMLIIDCPSTVTEAGTYSARSAAISGFSIFAKKRVFALTDKLEPDWKAIEDFLAEYGKTPFIVFGFTFLIWQYLYEEVLKRGLHYDFSQAILIHGGGWKKLENKRVTREEFKVGLLESVGIENCHDYYGMAEQAGSVYMECECGHLHASDYSGVLVRRAKDFSLCEVGETGIIQVLSTIPKSYPGHSILTEDEGVLLGEDDCPCGRRGVYFRVNGRLKNAIIRGCSDV